MTTNKKPAVAYSMIDFENIIAEAVALLDLLGNAYGQSLEENQKDGGTNSLGLLNIRHRTTEKLKECFDSVHCQIFSLERQLADARRTASCETSGPSQN